MKNLKKNANKKEEFSLLAIKFDISVSDGHKNGANVFF